MPVSPDNNEEFSLDELVAIHGLLNKEQKDMQFAIEGIAIDLGLENAETIQLLIERGYLPKP